MFESFIQVRIRFWNLYIQFIYTTIIKKKKRNL